MVTKDFRINPTVLLLISIMLIVLVFGLIYLIMWMTYIAYNNFYRNEPSHKFQDVEEPVDLTINGYEGAAKLSDQIADSVGKPTVFIKRDIFGSKEYANGEKNALWRLSYMMKNPPSMTFLMPTNHSKIGLINEEIYPWLYLDPAGGGFKFPEDCDNPLGCDQDTIPINSTFQNACSMWRIKEVYPRQYMIINNRFPATCISSIDPSHTAIDELLMYPHVKRTTNVFEFISIPGAYGKYYIRKAHTKSYFRTTMSTDTNNNVIFDQLKYGNRQQATKFSLETAIASSLEAIPAVWPVVRYGKPVKTRLYRTGDNYNGIKIGSDKVDATDYGNSDYAFYYGLGKGTWGEYVGFNVKAFKSTKPSSSSTIKVPQSDMVFRYGTPGAPDIKDINDYGITEYLWVGNHPVNTTDEIYSLDSGGYGVNYNYMTLSYVEYRNSSNRVPTELTAISKSNANEITVNVGVRLDERQVGFNFQG